MQLYITLCYSFLINQSFFNSPSEDCQEGRAPKAE
nr:MAG TPA: hypothetical protein [Caudoviricetes sp.]